MKAGKFVVIEGDKNDFFSMVTDMRLDANNQEVLLHPPGQEDALLRQVLAGTSTYNIVSLRPMLMMSKDAAAEEGPRPVKAIPSHFSEVQEAMAEDVAKIFGSEGDAEGPLLQHRPPTRHGHAGLPRHDPLCRALQRHLRQDRHGQVLPDAAGAVRADSLRQGRQPESSTCTTSTGSRP